MLRKFTSEEIEKLPLKHEARENPDLKVERSVVEKMDIPPLTKIANREKVIFEGADPKRVLWEPEKKS